MRLIDVDNLKRRIVAFCTGCSTTYLTIENMMMLINQAGIVDAVPVVRCKDCKYRTKDTRWTRAGFCGRRGAGDCFAAPPEGYCSYGKREETK